MAKTVTTSIRVDRYSIFDNAFTLSFQLAPGGKHDLRFIATYVAGGLALSADTIETLRGIGLKDGEVDKIAYEIHDWIEKPRKQMMGLSHNYTMLNRIKSVTDSDARQRERARLDAHVTAPASSDDFDEDFDPWTVTVDTLSVADDPKVRIAEATEQFPAWLEYKNAERRGAEEAALIAVEAPVMDWAMSALG